MDVPIFSNFTQIINEYTFAFVEFKNKMQELKEKEDCL